jgi:hypothetical protein
MSVKKLSIKKIKAIKGGETACTLSNVKSTGGVVIRGTGGGSCQ